MDYFRRFLGLPDIRQDQWGEQHQDRGFDEMDEMMRQMNKHLESIFGSQFSEGHELPAPSNPRDSMLKEPGGERDPNRQEESPSLHPGQDKKPGPSFFFAPFGGHPGQGGLWSFSERPQPYDDGSDHDDSQHDHYDDDRHERFDGPHRGFGGPPGGFGEHPGGFGGFGSLFGGLFGFAEDLRRQMESMEEFAQGRFPPALQPPDGEQPGYSIAPREPRTDSDLDDRNTDELYDLLKRGNGSQQYPMEDETEGGRRHLDVEPRKPSRFKSFFKSTTIRRIRKPDGSVEEERRIRDSSGNEEVITTHTEPQQTPDGHKILPPMVEDRPGDSNFSSIFTNIFGR